MIRHLVVMKFRDAADVPEAKQKLEALVGRVPQIDTLRVDVDTLGSPTGHQLALETTHRDEAALRAYQEHPHHREVAAWLRDHLADRAVVDATTD